MADRTQEARERVDVQADINVVLDTLLKADEIIEWYRRQTGGTRALAVLHAIDALGRIGSEAYDCREAIGRSLQRMARLRHADEVLDGYERDLEDLKAKLVEARADAETLTADLRREWWLNHGHDFARLYGDDGEMQCAGCADFKRDSIDRLRIIVRDARMERAAALAAAQEPTAAECPDCGLDLEPGETHGQHPDAGCVAQEPPAEGGDR